MEIRDALNDISDEFNIANYKFFNENIDALPENRIKGNFKVLLECDDEVINVFNSDSID